jgi:hypothetical protein
MMFFQLHVLVESYKNPCKKKAVSETLTAFNKIV